MTLFSKKSDENENKENVSTLGTRIAEMRKQKGYTQEEFSDMLGKMGNEMGLSIHAMHEDIFNAMHTI